MVRESSASEHGERPGLRTKTKQELENAWLELFRRRRRIQPDDTLALTDKNAKARIFTQWMDEWIIDNLTAEQRSRTRSKQISIFGAHLKNFTVANT